MMSSARRKQFNLNIKLVIFSDLIIKFEGNSLDEDELLARVGKFNFQSIKKLYGILNAKSDYVPIFDAECLIIRKMSMREYVETNKYSYYFSSRIQPSMSNHARHMQNEMNKLLETNNNFWFLETYLWIFSKQVLNDIVMIMRSKFGSMTDIKSEFFIEYCYYLYYFMNQDKYPPVKWVDTMAYIKGALSTSDLKHWIQNTPEWSVLEHCTTQIKGPHHIIPISKIHQELKIPVMRVIENNFDVALALSFTRNVNICVSNFCENIYKLVLKDFFNKKIKVLMSGLVRNADSVETIKNMLSPLHLPVLNCEIYACFTIENNNFANLFKTVIGPKDMIIDNKIYDLNKTIKYPYYIYNAKSVSNMYQMLYKKRKLLDFCSTDENDIYVYMRPDLVALDGIRLVEIIKGVMHDTTINDNTNTIYIPNLYNSVGVTDMFAIGNSSSIRKYLSIYDYADEFLSKYICNPEFITYKMICEYGLEIRFFDWNFKVGWHDNIAMNTWWRKDKYGLDGNKYPNEDLEIKMNSFETLYHNFSDNSPFILTHKKTGLNLYVENENILLDSSRASNFFIKTFEPYTRTNIKLDTHLQNMNKDGTGWNLFTIPKDDKLYGKGNDKIWAQFYINKDGPYYHIITSHKELNNENKFGRYVGIVNNMLVTNLNKSDNTEWIISKPIGDKKTQIKVFSSGSCRILTSLAKINNGNIKCVHTMAKNFIGTNFMGKLHTSKQHIQFVRYLKNELILTPQKLSYFLTTFNKTRLPECPRNNPLHSKVALSNEINSCDVYIFEISSIKDFIDGENHINIEFLNNNVAYDTVIQTYDDIVNDIVNLSNHIRKPIIFLCNFRPQIYGRPVTIPNREIIYNACRDGAKKTGNYFYDPSDIIKTYGPDKVLLDENHWNDFGHEIHAQYIQKLLNSIVN